MLLQRLYNWIKYKSLPTSFLFKNRLFIERNTKHRRIYSIFGALIRNSKWGNFELSNVKTQFRLNYTKYIFWIFIFVMLIFFSWFFKKYYIYTYAFNSVALFVWLSVDAFDYYLSFGLWCITALIAIATNWAYSYFLERVNFKKISLKTIFSDTFFDDLIRIEDISEHHSIFRISDLKYLFYNWVSKDESLNNAVCLETFFESSVNQYQWNNCYDFFIKLFKATYLCNLNNESNSIKHLHYTFMNLQPTYINSSLKKLFNHYGDTKVVNKYATLLTWYTLNSYTNYYSWKTTSSPSLRLFNVRHDWNLSVFDIEANKYHIFNSNVLGGFYLSNFSFSKLSSYSNFSELWNISAFARNQINAAKWNRWLYKYSILHRRFLRNSHKITLTKKLFASGFYNNQFFNRNTWNTAHVKSIDNTFIHNLSSIYYKNLFQSTSTLNWQSQTLNSTHAFSTKKNITFFSFYENSYLWVAKRFYSFNTIPSNFINSTLSVCSDKSANVLDQTSFKTQSLWHSILNSYLGKLYFFNTNTFDFTLIDDLQANRYFFLNGNKQNTNSYYSKDLHLIFDDNYLLTHELLDINYWVTSAPATIIGIPTISDYCSITTPNYHFFNCNKIFNNQNVSKKLVYTSRNSLLIESNYLFDVILVSYFY